MKYGLLTKQETCASETVLCRKHYTKENRKKVYDQLSDDIPSTKFKDVSGNDSIKCVICGRE